MEFFTVSGDMQYLLRYTATNPETYGQNIPVADNMIKSIKIQGVKSANFAQPICEGMFNLITQLV